MSMQQVLVVRPATPADVPAILAMQSRSLRQLGRGHYDRATLESAIAAGTLGPELLRSRRYQVAVLADRIVGSGGWLDGGAGAVQPLVPGRPPGIDAATTAVVRAVYVDPDTVRRGIGSRLMAAIEADALAAGKTRAELLATRMAVRFYSRLGYRMAGPLSLATAEGRLIEAFAMTRTLALLPAARDVPGRLPAGLAA